MKTDATDRIEAGLGELRRDPQRFRLWWRNLDFRRFQRRWKDWRALAAGDTMPPRLLAAHRVLLEREWARIEAFFARYESNRARLKTLRETPDPSCESPASEEGTRRSLDREWTRLENEACFSGDPGLFAQLEDHLDVAEAGAGARPSRPEDAAGDPVSPDGTVREAPADLRAQAKRLLDDGMLLLRRLDLEESARGAVMQDRRNILDHLENGESACAFWWAKDLHGWLASISEDRRPSPRRPGAADTSSCAKRHARFTATQVRVKKLLAIRLTGNTTAFKSIP